MKTVTFEDNKNTINISNLNPQDLSNKFLVFGDSGTLGTITRKIIAAMYFAQFL